MAVGSRSLHVASLFYQLMFMLTALGVLVTASIALSDLMAHKAFMDDDPKRVGTSKGQSVGSSNLLGAPSLLVAAGAISVIVASFGFFAALKRNAHMLRALIVMMIIVMVMELSAGIWAFATRSRTKPFIRSSLYRNMDSYEVGIKPEVILNAFGKKAAPVKTQTHPWDTLQKDLECCGVDGPGDYVPYGAAPFSCCAPKKKTSTTTTQLPVFYCFSLRQNGCLDPLDSYVRERLAWVGFFGVAATFVEVVGTMLTVALTISMKKDLQKIYQ